ncbi:hypothetical protein AUJ46_02305 [Candidatus Peregrinibacteria bacterium CG1_02_54_53]|nr:MAG: hypothetical protein AUJ46_02305 [Candidatus Peregrinibacteria bacterium CG1_02_54_53]
MPIKEYPNKKKLAWKFLIFGFVISFFVASVFQHVTAISLLWPAVIAGVFIAGVGWLCLVRTDDKGRRKDIVYMLFSTTFLAVSILFAVFYFWLGQEWIDKTLQEYVTKTSLSETPSNNTLLPQSQKTEGGIQSPTATKNFEANNADHAMEMEQTIVRYFDALKREKFIEAAQYMTERGRRMFNPNFGLEIPTTLYMTVATESPNVFHVAYRFKKADQDEICKTIAKVILVESSGKWLIEEMKTTTVNSAAACLWEL